MIAPHPRDTDSMNPFASILSTAKRTAGFDLRFFKTHLKFVGAIGVILMIPAVYASVYLSSLWDPASHTRNMIVALVNDDEGTTYQGTPVALGRSLVGSLTKDPRFNYVDFTDADEARHAVDRGNVSFAVLIPRDFSRVAMAGERLGGARFVVHASEGNNYTGAGFARRFAPELAQRINQSLNEQRFAALMKMASGPTSSLDQLRQAVTQLGEGAGQLAAGAQQAASAIGQLADGSARAAKGSVQLHQGLQTLQAGSRQLTGGMKQVGDAVQTMHKRLPADADLRRLREGSAAVASGQRELTAGLGQMEQGAVQLRDGSAKLGEEGGHIPFAGDAIEEGAGKLRDGAEQLRQGLASAGQAGQKLTQGSTQVADNVGALTQGVSALGNGLGQLSGALPPAATLDAFTSGSDSATKAAGELADGNARLQAGTAQLNQGLKQLEQGSLQLHDGLLLVRQRLPSEFGNSGSTAAGLSESVHAEMEITAPVPNQGTGMSPNFIPLALWVGCTLCTFIFAYRSLPAPLEGASSLGIVLGKLTTPALVVTGQSLVLLATLHFVLHIQVQDMSRFVITMMLTALTFLTVLFMLVRLFGNVGKLLALVLLVLQLAASGATLPIELSSPFFQAIHPYLPLTWVVRAMRIALFGAFEGAWGRSVLIIGGMACAAIAIASLPRRWNVVAPEAYEPVVD
jgi:putative membrane protein